MRDQLATADDVIDALAERGVGCVSMRELIESMAEVGVVFADGSQADSIRAMDEMDANA